MLPALVFILAAFLSFSTGTSWGTFGILIPIIIPVAQSICPELLLSSLAATLAGSVFGDHCSPISDTTILSSAGAGVNHLTHVSTQMIYSLTVAGCSLIGYLIIGITNGNLLLSLGTSIFILCIFTFIMHRRSKTILNKKIFVQHNKTQCYHSNIKRSIHYRYVHPLFLVLYSLNKFLF